MKTSNVLAALATPLATALLIASASSAKAETGSASEQRSAQSFGEAHIVPLRAVSPAQAKKMTGVYRMSDGRGMSLKRQGVWIQADLDCEPLTRLLASGDGQLRAPDGRMSMRFDFKGECDGADVTVTLLADRRQTATHAPTCTDNDGAWEMIPRRPC